MLSVCDLGLHSDFISKFIFYSIHKSDFVFIFYSDSTSDSDSDSTSDSDSSSDSDSDFTSDSDSSSDSDSDLTSDRDCDCDLHVLLVVVSSTDPRHSSNEGGPEGPCGVYRTAVYREQEQMGYHD